MGDALVDGNRVNVMETPIGYITLFEAVYAVGRAMFGPEWRYAIPFAPEIELNVHEPIIKAIAEGCESDLINAAYRRWDTSAEVLDPAVWRRLNWRNHFMTGTIELELPLLDDRSLPISDGRTVRCTREIFVRSDSLQRFVSSLEPTTKTPIVLAPPAPKRGPKANVLGRVKEAMRRDLADGAISADALGAESEKSLADRYGASRDTVRKARNGLVETRSKLTQKSSANDK